MLSILKSPQTTASHFHTLMTLMTCQRCHIYTATFSDYQMSTASDTSSHMEMKSWENISCDY